MDYSDQPLVSIVTPSLNQARYLEETIHSVLNQDYPAIEYIITDGGSTDGSVEIIKKYADRLAYWVSEPDQGQTYAILKGFARARGELLGWLCADDILEPSMVKISVYFMLLHPEVGLTYGDRALIDARGNTIDYQRQASFRPLHMRMGLKPPQETVLFRRSAFDAAGGLDVSLEFAMDWDLWCRMSRVTAFRHIPAYLGRFRIYPGTKSVRYSQQLKDAGFRRKYSAEVEKLHQKYYGVHASQRIIQLGRLLCLIQGFLERRTAAHRRDLAQIIAIRSE